MKFTSNQFNNEVKKESKAGKIFLFIFFGLLIIAVIGGLIYKKKLTSTYNRYYCYVDTNTATKALPNPKEGETMSFSIPVGTSPSGIADLLNTNGILPNIDYFLCYSKKLKIDSKFQAGYYEIKGPITIEQLAATLQAAKVKAVTVTIREGLRKDEISKLLEEKLGFAVLGATSKFTQKEYDNLLNDTNKIKTILGISASSYEGFLFPDTYIFKVDITPEEVLDIQLNTFKQKVLTPFSTDFSRSKLSKKDVVTLASIIEKEAGSSFEEKQTVAGILIKRMQNGWNLEVDATILYNKKDWKHIITVQDKASNNAYNTYIRKGLPPTAISNPGVESIQAVLQYKSSPYWFYMHDNDGIIHYSKTYEEHSANVQKYLR